MAEVQYSLRERVGKSLVRLRVRMNDADAAASALHLLADPQHWQGSEPIALWLGPDQWLLASDSKSAKELIASIDDKLSNQLYATADLSDALDCLEFSGPGARTILSMGCGLDLDSSAFTDGQCARTRFACVPLVIAATGEDQFDLYVDRSYSHYLQQWIANAARDPLTQAS